VQLYTISQEFNARAYMSLNANKLLLLPSGTDLDLMPLFQKYL